MRFNATRFARCRNAHLCTWSHMMNQQLRAGSAVGSKFTGAAMLFGSNAMPNFGAGATTSSGAVLGETPLQNGFAEQNRGFGTLAGLLEAGALGAGEEEGSGSVVESAVGAAGSVGVEADACRNLLVHCENYLQVTSWSTSGTTFPMIAELLETTTAPEERSSW
ncbi:unnamed protein product [Amoebophrya sp. A120]|nr:unnamed protein product [Amoebophrya sp. A120]|eukprot:GSA120T00020049001.1